MTEENSEPLDKAFANGIPQLAALAEVLNEIEGARTTGIGMIFDLVEEARMKAFESTEVQKLEQDRREALAEARRIGGLYDCMLENLLDTLEIKGEAVRGKLNAAYNFIVRSELRSSDGMSIDDLEKMKTEDILVWLEQAAERTAADVAGEDDVKRSADPEGISRHISRFQQPLTLKQIAERVGCTSKTIRNWRNDCNIRQRPQGEDYSVTEIMKLLKFGSSKQGTFGDVCRGILSTSLEN